MRPAILLLGIVNLVLAAILMLELRPAASPDLLPGALSSARPRPVMGAREGEIDSTAAIATILARPVFSATRRPAMEVVAPVAARRPAVLPRLTAVMIGPFGQRAIFAASDGGKPLVVQAGDSVGEFRVQSIETGVVTLSGPEGVRQLRPRFASADVAGTTTGTSPPTGVAPIMPPGFPPTFIRPVPQPGRRP